jgi:benzodiazapine receptor
MKVDIELIKKLLVVVSPLFLGFATNKLCDMPNSDHLKIQPPGWVFGVVWTYMYLVMGILILNLLNLKTRRFPGEQVFVYTCLVIHCLMIFTWPYAFSCKKNAKAALFILFGAIITGLLLLMHQFHKKPYSYLLVPYLCWLLFAMLLNVEYVQNE